MIQDYDFENFKSMSLKILEKYPENKLAKMFYKLNVSAESYIHGDFVGIDFSTYQLQIILQAILENRY